MLASRPHLRPSGSAFVLLALAAVAGCSRQEPPPSAGAPAAAVQAEDESAGLHLPAGIDWFDGDVDAAFTAAKAADKPLFLYWGAEWCPPCAQIKATIFNRREFQERSRLFVPVYLDGDTPSAQKQGERFGVVGYPTMILFDPEGTEITRLPGTVDIDRYAKILDVALAEARPVKDILAAAAHGGEVTRGDWQLLAYYSWATDNGRAMERAKELGTFRVLSSRCPVELEPDCARLFFEYLGAAARASGNGQSGFTGLDRAQARKRLLALLARPAVGRANVDNLLYGAKETVGLLSDESSAERRQLVTAWNEALDRIAADDGDATLSAPERLGLIRARLVLAGLAEPGAPPPAALVEQARAAVAQADAATTDAYARQALVNSAVGLYWEAGLDEEANRLLVAELDRSKSPYYFMLDLAELAEKAGREEEAVQWLARAYDGAQGPATRFQWGYNYLVGLIELTPGDTATVERAGLQLLDELDGSPDAFYQRTRMRLEQLSGKLLEWGSTTERAAVVETLRARAGEICRRLPEGDTGRGNCERFLKPVAPATQGA